MHKIIESLNWRYACKKFDSTKSISEEDFNTILESLRLTASSYGIQPWKFVVVKNQEKREELIAASYNQRQVAEASHLIVLCAPSEIDEALIDSYLADTAKTRGQDVSELAGFKKMLMSIPGKPEEWKKAWAKNQIYIALGNLLTVCAEMRIDSCPMEGFSPAKYDEILNLKEYGLRSVVVCPVGYRHADDKYIDIKKVRFPNSHLVVEI